MKQRAQVLGMLFTLALLLPAGGAWAAKHKAKKAVPAVAEAAPAASAEVIEVVGKGDAQVVEGGSWSALKPGDLVHLGSRMRTGENSSLKFRTPDGAEVALAANTEVTVAALSTASTRRSALQFYHGFLRALFNGGAGKSSFDVYNVNAVAAVKGTDWSIEGDDKRFDVKVYSSHHEGVELSDWRGRAERLVRPGEDCGLDKSGGLQTRVLNLADLDRCNHAFGGLLKALSTLPKPPLEPPKPLSPEAKKQQVLDLIKANPGVHLTQAEAEKLADNAASGKVSVALVERLVEEAAKPGTGTGNFTQLAHDQGLDRGMIDILDKDKDQGPPAKPGQDAPKQTPATTPAPTADAPKQSSLAQEAQAALVDLSQDLDRAAKQDQAGRSNDLLDGNTFIDHLGYRVELSHVILRPDPATIDKIEYSQRTDGPNSGQSIFSELVTFNKALPDDWTGIFNRSLNDPDNLASGQPEYYRTLQQISVASPGGCQLCISETYDAPVLLNQWAQGVLQQFSVMGLDRGQRHFGADGSLLAGSDNIQVTATQEAGDWRFDYVNQTLGVTMFTARVWLLDQTGVIQDPTSFGNNLLELQGFAATGTGNYDYELELLAPEFLGKSIDVLAAPDVFEDSFR